MQKKAETYRKVMFLPILTRVKEPDITKSTEVQGLLDLNKALRTNENVYENGKKESTI